MATNKAAEAPRATERIAADQALQRVLDHQARIAERTQVCQDIERAIATQEDAKVHAQSSIASTAALESRLEEIRANLALRVVTNEEAQRLESETEAKILTIKNDAGSAQRAIVLAQRAIDGLNRRLTLARGELAETKAAMPHLMDTLILAEADVLATEYLAAADTLIDRFNRVMALDRMYKNRPEHQRSTAILNVFSGIRIPLFRTPACEGREQSAQNAPYGLLYERLDERELRMTLSEEHDRLLLLGVLEPNFPR